MKIKCPICGADVYTNPFGRNEKLSCSECGRELYRNQAAGVILKRLLLFDLGLGAVAIILVHYLGGSLQSDGFILLIIVSEWLFEMPQRTLIRMGILHYDEKRADDLDSGSPGDLQ